MQSTNARVTARISRTADGEVYPEYHVDGVVYSSADELEAALDAC